MRKAKRSASTWKVSPKAESVKTTLLRLAETKNTLYSVAPETMTLYHNKGNQNGANIVAALLRCPQGNSKTTRIGEKVQATGLSVRLFLYNGTNAYMKYRIMVCSGQRDDTQATAPPAFWKDESANKILDTVNTERYNLLYHKYLNVEPGDKSYESGSTLQDITMMHKLFIPLNREIQYLNNGSLTPKNDIDNLFLVIIPYRNSGDTTATSVSNVEIVWKMYFKDI